MKPFTKLSYNLQGQKRTIDLAPCTVLIGRNRSGKTTALNAIRFALTGLPKQHAADYLSPKQTLFSCRLEGPDAIADLDGMVVDGKPKGACSEFGGALETMSALDRSNLLMPAEDLSSYGSQRLREALLERFGSEVDLEPSPDLDVTKRRLWTEVMQATVAEEPRSPIATLLEFADGVRARVRDLSARCKQLRADLKWHKEAGAGSCAARCEIEAIALEAKLAQLKTLDQIVAFRVAACLKTVKENAEFSVNTWMPKGFTASVAIEGKDVEWLVAGADGSLRSKNTQSGAERGALSFALKMAWAGPGKILLLEAEQDLAHFDTQNIGKILTLLVDRVESGELQQVVIAAPDWFDCDIQRYAPVLPHVDMDRIETQEVLSL